MSYYYLDQTSLPIEPISFVQMWFMRYMQMPLTEGQAESIRQDLLSRQAKLLQCANFDHKTKQFVEWWEYRTLNKEAFILGMSSQVVILNRSVLRLNNNMIYPLLRASVWESTYETFDNRYIFNIGESVAQHIPHESFA